MLRSICAIFVLVSLLKDETQLSVNAVEKSELYPYGLSAGDTKLEATKLGNENEDISSNEIKLKTNIKFYSNEYGAIYVSLWFLYIFQIIFFIEISIVEFSIRYNGIHENYISIY